MVLGILRLLVSARSGVLWTALQVESVDSSQIVHGQRRAVLWAAEAHCGRPARQLREAQKAGGVVDSLDAAVWEAATEELTASQQAEIEAKRRVVVGQPTAESAHKQFEQEVASLSELESAHQRQQKAAVDACFLVAERATKSRSRSCSKRLWTQRWKRPEAGTYHASSGEDVATLLSLLPAALRKGQWQCCLPSSIRNQGLESFFGLAHTTTRLLLGAARPRYAACASNAICDCTECGPCNHPCYPSWASMHGSGPPWAPRFLVQLALLMTLMAIILSSNLSGQLRRQEVVNKARHDPRAYRSVSQQHPSAPNAQSPPTQLQSASLGIARFFVSSPAVARPVELSGGAPSGNTEDANMGGILGDKELESFRVHRLRRGPVPKGQRQKRAWCGWWPRGGWQDGPDTDPCPSKVTRKTSVNTTDWGPVKKWLPEAGNADFLLALETHLPKDALVAEEAWMRSQVWRACIAPALFWSPQHCEWVSTKQTAHSKGSAGVMVAAALRQELATPHGGAGDRGIELCKGRELALYHSGIVTGGALILSVTCTQGGSPPRLCRSSSVATSRWRPSSWRIADGCKPSVALWWRRSSPRSRRPGHRFRRCLLRPRRRV